jgi:hypothetical protein
MTDKAIREGKYSEATVITDLLLAIPHVGTDRNILNVVYSVLGSICRYAIPEFHFVPEFN